VIAVARAAAYCATNAAAIAASDSASGIGQQRDGEVARRSRVLRQDQL
jgi:hypothetical protein